MLTACSPPATPNSVYYFKVTRPRRYHLDKPLYDIAFTHRFLHGKHMSAFEQTRLCAVVVDCVTWPLQAGLL